MKKVFASLASLAFLTIAASCTTELPYNSNSGNNGSRDTASQLLVNTSKIDELSAIDADNEDWYYFAPQEKGFIKINAFVDSPQNIILKISLADHFGRPLQTITTNHTQNIYELPEIEVAPENYFISMITNEGKSAYTIRADFRLPDPEPDCTIGTFQCVDQVLQECQAKVGFVDVLTCSGSTPVCDEESQSCHEKTERTKCVPLSKCKKGQKCCKAASAPADDDGDIRPTDKTIKGTIVLITPRGGDISDVKINGIGTKKGGKKGAKAFVRGLKRKVDIYECKASYCMATVSATTEELNRYGTVDVVVD